MSTEAISSSNPTAQLETSARPSQLSPVRARDFLGVRPFHQFGNWSPPQRIAYSGATFRLVNWIAQNRRTTANYDDLWTMCQLANPDCFQQLDIIHLSRPSWFLPKGDVVFQVIKDPTNIPDNPPKGVLLRHMEALDYFGTRADFYFLRPTFAADTMEVFTGEAAREHAEEDKSDILFMAKLYGPVLRGAATTKQVASLAASAAKFAVRQGFRGLMSLERSISDQIERRRIQREAQRIPTGMHPDAIRALMLRSLELDLFREADLFRQALRSWEGTGMQSRMTATSYDMGIGKLAARATSESSFVQEARRQGSSASVVELRAVYQEVQELRSWDPITCFELHDQPGKLWLEAHWFEDQNGKHFVHY